MIYKYFYVLGLKCFILKCDCCELEFTQQVLKTMPDICIVYKLHLESRFDQINMYDWLQVKFNLFHSAIS